MAIFLDKIKGCGLACDGSEKYLFTHINWNNSEIKSAISPNMKYTPTISLARQGFENTELGHIITSGAAEQIFSKQVTFNSGVKTDNFIARTDRGTIICESPLKVSENLDAQTITCKGSSELTNTKTDTITIGTTQTPSGDQVLLAKNGTFEGPCSAQYFNATSDRRAKTNIDNSYFSGLDIVKKLPIYTFNYKDTNAASIGIMAQEAKNIDFNTDFNLVNNLEASGENNDYMTIKESKLVYVLWKAVQELSEEIASLKEELNKKASH